MSKELPGLRIIKYARKILYLIEHIVNGIFPSVSKCDSKRIVRHTHKLHRHHAAFYLIANLFLCHLNDTLKKLS